jgi:hypothetical protein
LRPTATYITRLTATATLAYLLALLIPVGTARPVLAPLTALLVLQASLYQTIRSGLRKVLSVTVGVLVAVGVSAITGFSWWQLGLLIAAALLAGRLLRLGDDLLEVPISAMLIFSSAGHHAAATGRVADTLVGTVAGLAGGLVFAGQPKVQPARSAVGQLAGGVADLLDRMATDLAALGAPAGPFSPADAAEWLTHARALRDDIERVDDRLREVSDSVRLNPRALVAATAAVPVSETTVALRGGLETLEHAALTLRGLARSVLESVDMESEASPIRDAETRIRLADVLSKLSAAIRTYGQLVQAPPTGVSQLEFALQGQLAEAHRQQDRLAGLLKPRARSDGAPSEWPLRGEILAHVDRLRTGLSPDSIPRRHQPASLKRPSLKRPSLKPPSLKLRRIALPSTRTAQLRPGQLLTRGTGRVRTSPHRAR